MTSSGGVSSQRSRPLGTHCRQRAPPEGRRGLSLRAVATALDVAPNALYRHVAGRHGLKRMLAAEDKALLVPRPDADVEDPAQLWLFVLGVVARLSGSVAAPQATVALRAFLHGMPASNRSMRSRRKALVVTI